MPNRNRRVPASNRDRCQYSSSCLPYENPRADPVRGTSTAARPSLEAEIVTTSPIPTGDAFDRLMQTIIDRRDGSADRSYTQRLLSGGVEAIARKILEEAGEVVESAQHLDARRSALPPESRNELSQFPEESTRKELGTTAHFVHETADLLYHLWVMLAKHHVPLEWVRQELDRRAGVSGLDEKSNRPHA